ncbi:Metal-dependent hydrolases of the beta-lactamase superfamily I [Fimbriiglobus ruber]|uniref:Metal-dependent hydrolases of the beta-lactamase superfamily I n=1 Tax=Fimbriiglobus ruber TaxID=1908690 RepID=A0A225DF87_9BACT|nr:Metal-dependent hydrolases of the beta-lactamase superfamily I [Fimbriiglobus ruber]
MEVDGLGLLIDCGFPPHVLAARLSAVGRSWKSVSAVLLTHTHGDHWNSYTLEHLRRLNVPLVAHPDHHAMLAARAEHEPLRRAGLARPFGNGWFDLAPTLSALPIRVPHDSEPTFAFRFESRDGAGQSGWAVGYVSDAGHVTSELTRLLAGVDLLAVEYNHDVAMQRASGRPAILVSRVLGKNGHLSNAQAAELTRAVAKSGGPDGLRHLVQLHLSRDCNTPELAARAGREALAACAPAANLITSSQFTPTAPVELVSRPGRPPRPAPPAIQPALPGMETDVESSVR